MSCRIIGLLLAATLSRCAPARHEPFTTANPIASLVRSPDANLAAVFVLDFEMTEVVRIGRTVGPPPALLERFGKRKPADGGVNRSLVATLAWDSSDDATGFEYCVDTRINGTCDDRWMAIDANTVDVSLPGPRRVYEWQVRALTADGLIEADGGDWWTFTTALAAGATSPSEFQIHAAHRRQLASDDRAHAEIDSKWWFGHTGDGS